MQRTAALFESPWHGMGSGGRTSACRRSSGRTCQAGHRGEVRHRRVADQVGLARARSAPRVEPETHGRFRPAAEIAERVSYGTQFGLRIPAILYVPESPAAKIRPLSSSTATAATIQLVRLLFRHPLRPGRRGRADYDPSAKATEPQARWERHPSTTSAEPDEMGRRMGGLMVTDVMQAVSYSRGPRSRSQRSRAPWAIRMGPSCSASPGPPRRACVLRPRRRRQSRWAR